MDRTLQNATEGGAPQPAERTAEAQPASASGLASGSADAEDLDRTWQDRTAARPHIYFHMHWMSGEFIYTFDSTLREFWGIGDSVEQFQQ